MKEQKHTKWLVRLEGDPWAIRRGLKEIDRIYESDLREKFRQSSHVIDDEDGTICGDIEVRSIKDAIVVYNALPGGHGLGQVRVDLCVAVNTEAAHVFANLPDRGKLTDADVYIKTDAYSEIQSKAREIIELAGGEQS